ncbi:hypothetical protein JZ751_013105 [Albula glossodonta]|uniref:tRNA-splicing endonuclease subunit Sen54 N-terminal domain-containing protein n=1 Tax=Albula glossodonta TaxID=121402 RepID=A0A8T2P4Z5_9TELE|nr:hypothetical protein JZ751_013105 [Albula glossodonta]
MAIPVGERVARSRSHKIPVRGQKDFIPDGSKQQQERLERSLEEQWTLVSEERVERLGNLVKAVWIPKEDVVELQSPAGKFWQTMGFSENGKQFLLPEEALYLMECGNVQVFCHELPMSIQEGYERFLSRDTLSLQQYQVFGHLKRLGYVVTRFDPSSRIPSLYEQQLNLPQVSDRPGRRLKRKRSLSPTSSQTDGQEGQVGEKMEVEQCQMEDQKPDSIPEPVCTHSRVEEEEEKKEEEDVEGPAVRDPAKMETTAESTSGRSWWVEQKADPELRLTPCSGPRWDFHSISFPDLGCRGRPPSLAPPDPALLPGLLSVGRCDVAPWLRELNKRKEHLSHRERERLRDRARYRRDVNEDREVRRCRNWADYRQLLERRSQCRHQDRPANLWEGKVTPLVQPGQYTSYGDLMNRTGVIQPLNFLEAVSRLGQGSEEFNICYNVYQPDTVSDYKKTSPGKPYSRMCVCSFDGPVPDLRTLKLLACQSGDVPVTFAVVDHGDISFYSFKSFQLPTDLPH